MTGIISIVTVSDAEAAAYQAALRQLESRDDLALTLVRRVDGGKAWGDPITAWEGEFVTLELTALDGAERFWPLPLAETLKAHGWSVDYDGRNFSLIWPNPARCAQCGAECEICGQD